jgi:hypothetical protein
MLQNALRSLSLSDFFLFWHFNIITLVNPFSERFESRHERDQSFSVPDRSRSEQFSPGPIPVLIKRKILILISVLEPLWLSLLNYFCSVLEEYL